MSSSALDARLRVVVTGMGAVSCLGWGLPPLWSGLRLGKTGIAPFGRFDHSRHRTHVAGEVPPGPPAGFRRPSGWGRLASADQFALFSASEAIEQAGLGGPLGRTLTGVFFGTSTAGLPESEQFLEALWQEDPERARRRLSLLASHHLNAPGDAIARHLGIDGPVQTISSACASSSLALDAALRAVRSGEVDCALAGGSDSLCTLTYSGFNSLRAVDDQPCRPFREGRNGMSLGEGSAVLVLERLDDALRRGAKPLAEFLGSGASCDATHMTAPQPEGLGAAAAMKNGLADAGIGPDSIGFINAHGTGTPLNDVAEHAAFVRTFGERAARVPVSATKSVIGHLLGASGAIEAVATVLCLRAGEAHPTAGGGSVDPRAAVDLVLGRARPLAPATPAVSTSLGFGGANTALVLAPWIAA